MKRLNSYIPPECDNDLYNAASLLCASADLESLVEDTDTIDWV